MAAPCGACSFQSTEQAVGSTLHGVGIAVELKNFRVLVSGFGRGGREDWGRTASRFLYFENFP